MKILKSFLILFFAFAWIGFLAIAGCKSIQSNPELGDALLEMAKQRAPRTAVALVIQNNPDLAPAFNAIGQRLKDADGTLTPEEVYQDILQIVATFEPPAKKSAIILLSIQEGVEWYRALGGETGLQVATETQVETLHILGDSILSGVTFGEQLSIVLQKDDQ